MPYAPISVVTYVDNVLYKVQNMVQINSHINGNIYDKGAKMSKHWMSAHEQWSVIGNFKSKGQRHQNILRLQTVKMIYQWEFLNNKKYRYSLDVHPSPPNSCVYGSALATQWLLGGRGHWWLAWQVRFRRWCEASMHKFKMWIWWKMHESSGKILTSLFGCK